MSHIHSTVVRGKAVKVKAIRKSGTMILYVDGSVSNPQIQLKHLLSTTGDDAKHQIKLKYQVSVA